MEWYKESGIDWIGKIPIEWDIKKIKYVYKLQTGFTPDTSKPEYYDNENGYTWISIADMNDKFIYDSKSKISELYIKEKHPNIIKKNNLLYSFKLSVGKIGFNIKDVYTNEAIASFETNNDVCLNYLYYAAYLIEFNANTNIYGAKILNQNLINNALIINPPIQEQKQIADFLDEKVGKIDKILEDLNKQIEILKKYRNNIIYESTTYGIENTADLIYTDNIFYKKTHKNWHLVALKRLTKVLTCGVASTPEYTDKDNGILFLSAQNIQNNKLDLSTKNYIPSELHKKITKYTKPQYGDVLQVRVGATIGKSAIVDIKDEFSIYVSLTLMRVNEKINNKYLNYVISTDQFKQMVSLDVDFAGSQGNLNVGDLKETKIPLPDYKEQIKIINYLDEKCSNIDKTIQIKQKQIDKLENYKKSLIYEYVTGKKRVKEE